MQEALPKPLQAKPEKAPPLPTPTCDSATASTTYNSAPISELGSVPDTIIKEWSYYETVIESFGWYNIDQLLNEFMNCVENELDIRVNGLPDGQYFTSLVIPDHRIYLKWSINEPLLLPEGLTAYLITISEGKKLSLGVKQFVTARKQSVTIEMKPATKKEIMQFIQSLQRSVRTD